MGLCGSTLTPEEKHSKMVENELQKEHAREKQKVKLLLLGACNSCSVISVFSIRIGAGESGKSTLFKQMKVRSTNAALDNVRQLMHVTAHLWSGIL